jgi:hypothetical protein
MPRACPLGPITRGAFLCPAGSGQRPQPDPLRMMSQPLAYVSLAILVVPLLAIVWLLLGRRLRGWVPIVALLGVIVLIQIAGELGGAELLVGLMYYLAGAKP